MELGFLKHEHIHSKSVIIETENIASRILFISPFVLLRLFPAFPQTKPIFGRYGSIHGANLSRRLMKHNVKVKDDHRT